MYKTNLYLIKKSPDMHVHLTLSSSTFTHRCQLTAKSLQTLRVVLARSSACVRANANSASSPACTSTLPVTRNSSSASSWCSARDRLGGGRWRRSCTGCSLNNLSVISFSCREQITYLRGSSWLSSRRWWRRASTAAGLTGPDGWTRDGIVIEVRVDVDDVAWLVTLDEAWDRDEGAWGSAAASCDGNMMADQHTEIQHEMMDEPEHTQGRIGGFHLGMGCGYRAAGCGEGSLHLGEPWGWCTSMFLYMVSDVLFSCGRYFVRASGHVTDPPENVGPKSRILNHTCPDPSKSAAAPGAAAM